MQSITLDTHAILAPSFGTTLSFEVRANCDWQISVTATTRRGRQLSRSEATGTATVAVAIGENATSASRSLTLRVAAQAQCCGGRGAEIRAGFRYVRGLPERSRSADAGRRRRLHRDAGGETPRHRRVERSGQQLLRELPCAPKRPETPLRYYAAHRRNALPQSGRRVGDRPERAPWWA